MNDTAVMIRADTTTLPRRTAKQIAASRANGKLSGGPKTAVGKQRSGQNAIRHGIFARAVPQYRHPVYYTRDEVTSLYEGMIRERPCRTALGCVLTENLAVDILRLRHVRALEHAALDPNVEYDLETERALQMPQGELTRPAEDHQVLLSGAKRLHEAIQAGQPIDLADHEHDLMTEEIWRRLNGPARHLKSTRKRLADLEQQLLTVVADDREMVEADRAQAALDLRDAEEWAKTQEMSLYGVETFEALQGILRGAEPILASSVTHWGKLVSAIIHDESREVREHQERDSQLERIRRIALVRSIGLMEPIEKLAEYAARIQKSMERTWAMIQEVEGQKPT